ncbi:hypothetical protein THAOC_35406 [Thalassiosira oceanica]|uniref:Uncharacterized protein n=1 Tax=Thalassiosira oceanica TaxID=159749 RepID=K0R0Y9_THAOC|nr:hypothetical protein THAOC_35406 [Thalassiosira oceanica]|eukprot:EJK45953.1 hypothetical protein THAOC_35406 [Thalassiosira oceanica]
MLRFTHTHTHTHTHSHTHTHTYTALEQGCAKVPNWSTWLARADAIDLRRAPLGPLRWWAGWALLVSRGTTR